MCASARTRNQMPSNGLWVRIPCPPHVFWVSGRMCTPICTPIFCFCASKGHRGMDSTIPLSSNELIESQLRSALDEIEKTYNSDVITFRGPIEFGLDDHLRDAVEAINNK